MRSVECTPKHLERYTSFTEGRFEQSQWKAYMQKLKAQAGQKKFESATARIDTIRNLDRKHAAVPGMPQTMSTDGRKLIVVDVRKTMSAEMADYFIQVQPNKDYELMQALRVSFLMGN
jgi:formylmethanofuran dehydrogenase subunit B